MESLHWSDISLELVGHCARASLSVAGSRGEGGTGVRGPGRPRLHNAAVIQHSNRKMSQTAINGFHTI